MLDSLSISAVRRSLNMTEDDIAWTTAYSQLGSVASILYGMFSDVIGRRPMFLIGLPMIVVYLVSLASAQSQLWWGL
eukprot:gene7148-24211_t